MFEEFLHRRRLGTSHPSTPEGGSVFFTAPEQTSRPRRCSGLWIGPVCDNGSDLMQVAFKRAAPTPQL